MERKPLTQPPADVHDSQNSSLAEKLKSHYRENKSKNFHERVDAWTQFMIKLPLPLPLLVTTVFVTWYYGVTEMVPELYGGYGSLMQYLQILIGSVLAWQVFVFWCAIRFVDSSYKTFRKILSQSGPCSTIMQRVFVNNSNTKDYEMCRLKTDDLKSDSNWETNKHNSTLLNQDSYSTKDERSFSSRKQHENGRTSVWASYLLPGYCLICNDVKPPRCHHCPVCDVCVLKRDHHCYFAGSCVGWRNHRYFIVFCFWASLSSSYVSVHLFYFIHKTLWSSMTYVDLFAPCAVLRCIIGSTSLPVVIYICLASSHLYCILLGTKFVVEHLYLVTKGLTTFENNPRRKGLRVVDTRTVNDKFRSVFGKYYLMNWLMPTHRFFPPVEDPVNWPTVKTY
ncbi:palmitoyltransferase PFA3-like [Gigantopelta aegis]|uniref:palmitoyltransferase PFA3-like n=1 Tax=Gigantopelta aegis TaxID=1735272 RepID=UPI001B889DB3|nr:palmitoyltransferase PFA3-like [Gigantopelta aegis]